MPLARNLVGQGCRIFRVDWSHAHAHDMPLTEQVAQQRAFFKAMGSGRHALSQQLQKLGNYFGGWRALDYTHGAGGHHLHAHSALFLDGAASESDLHEVISGAYEVAARKVGLTVGSAGVYVARIGPEGVRYLHKPGLVHARNLTGALIPSQLLLRASEGDAEAAQAWVEYAEAMRGVRKLSTTPGLRARAAHVPVTQDGQDDLLAQVAIPLGANQVRSVAPGTPVPSLTVLANLGLTLRPAWPTRAPRTAARAWPSQHAGAQQRAPQALPL